ncbi:hypothetical protein [Wolbachia endosymbiont of Folsomia candida]|uniref:hypothetical protein n=1 Tax=Wolbachia endosymbiont of Folsomia candida TaxID=169402 RepID=UPI000AF9B26B|nr:hypothetical protein [Wolbachia endosymbiont of Folsomia candida]APR98512.1 hypothetical protein ASM33_04580 [Wolbachia endosymbiont of Folsomia candida]
MFDYENEYGSDGYNIINQHIEAEISRRTGALKEDYDKLKQNYQKLYDDCNNYYQAYVFTDYSST